MSDDQPDAAPQPELSRHAARGASIALGAQGSRFVLQLVSLVVLSRLLTPTDFGLVAMVTAILGVAEILRDFGLSSAAIQAKELSDAERTNLFWSNVGIGAACAVILIALTPVIVRFYDQPALAPIVVALSSLFILNGANAQFRAELSRSLRFKALATTDVAAQAAGVSCAIVAALLGAGPWAIVTQQAVLVVTTLVLNAFQSGWWPGWPRRDVSIRRFFRYGGGLAGMQLLGYVTNNIDNVAIGAVWGSSALGLYSRAYQLLIVPLNQVSDALTRVVLPVLSRVQDDEETYQRYLGRIRLVGYYLFGTSFAIAAGLSVPLVRVMLGPQWGAVAPIFCALAIGGIFRGYSQVTYWIVLSRALTGAQFKIYLVMRPFMIALILGGLPWGPVGVAIGHSIAFVVEWAVSLWWVCRNSGLAFGPLLWAPLRSLLVVSAPAAVIAFLGSRLSSVPILSLLAGTATAALFLAAVLAVSKREREDARAIVDSLRRAVGR